MKPFLQTFLLCAICIFVAGCANQKPEVRGQKSEAGSRTSDISSPISVPMPPSPFVAGKFESRNEKSETAQGNSVIAPPSAPRVMGWTWPYPEPMPVENVVFEFFSTTNLDQPFTKHGETNQPVYWFIADKPQEFFKLRASNTVTGLVSEWNR